MKTKIVYISGGDNFDAASVRAALDEVRKAVDLPSDVILFGISVDDAPSESEERRAESEVAVEAEIVAEPKPKRVRKAKPKEVKEVIEEISPVPAPVSVPEPEQVIEAPQENAESTEPAEPAEPAKIIPILSFLGANKKNEEVIEKIPEPAPVPEKIIISETVSTTIEIGPDLTDDLPEPEEEKTLEQLFKKISPLSEDKRVPEVKNSESDFDDAATSAGAAPQVDDTNAVLTKLAAEFAERQNEITAAPGGGKIGKLRNILPFKKVKKEETGLMGDLFGWAGIAANDDEFSF
ncbi:MAG: hypothetical protein LBJ18_04765 [Rickettsiales bacterium]|jgi:hypothetical protein|nr:hypothetical protein [Rickettsiales bacterium]